MRKSVLFSALVCAILLVSAGSFFGQNDRSARLSALTSDVAERAAHGRFADTGFATAAKSRFRLMSQLAETDPQAVLDNALTDEVLARIPASTKGYFERRDTLTGELEVLAECEEHDGRIHRLLKQGEKRTPLHFVSEPSDDLLTGAEVNTLGVLIGDRMVLEADGMTSTSSKTSGETTNSALAGATGEIKVLVLLVNFQNDTRQPYSASQANNLMFNPANSASVTNYYREASYGLAWLAGDTTGWFTLPMDGGTNACNNSSMLSSLSLQAAANSGIVLSNYKKYMFVFPNSGCSWSGMSDMGSKSWINGSMVLRTMAHELGHGLGLYHAKARTCSEITTGTCATSEYGHNSDSLGQTGVTGHFHPYQKERLGWLGATGSPGILSVQGAGNYTISPLSLQDGNPKALRIQQNSSTWYYVEFRRPVGFDSFVSNNGSTMNGVLITQNSSASANYLLDMVPSTTHWSDAALQMGRSFRDTATGMTLTVMSVSSSGATVNVSYGDIPCVDAAPTVTTNAAATQWATPGTKLSYSITVTNNSSGCQSNSFNVSAAVPSGWAWSTSTPTLNIFPGTSASATVQVNVPAGASEGPSTVNLSAVNTSSAQGSSVSRQVSVFSSLGVTAETDKAVYSSGQTVLFASTVTAGGSPVSGVSVKFTLTKPNGKTASFSATTNANGVASYSYRLNKKQDPLGSFSVNSTAFFIGITGSGTGGFAVK